MELANYNWLLSESSGQASSFLMDLIAFLQSTFQSFTNLKVWMSYPLQFFQVYICVYWYLISWFNWCQEHVAQNACLTSCRHIAQILMDLLLNEDVKQISMGALQQVNLDVIQCERKYCLKLYSVSV